jgi:hypothetical protein
MSVNDCKKSIGAICYHVLRDYSALGSAEIIYTRDDRLKDEDFIRKFSSTTTTIEDFRESAITAYFNRVAIANELAIMLTYKGADCQVHGLDKEDIKPDPSCTSTAKRIYHTLSSIQYNLVANSGSMMFSGKDEEILNNLIAHFAYEVIRNVDRVI